MTYNLEVGDNKLIDLLVACGEPFPLKDADGNEVVGGLDSSVMFLPTWDDSHTPSREGTSSTFMTKSVSLALVFITTSQNRFSSQTKKVHFQFTNWKFFLLFYRMISKRMRKNVMEKRAVGLLCLWLQWRSCSLCSWSLMKGMSLTTHTASLHSKP